VDPETRDELDQTMAATAAQTGAVLHTYPRPGRAVRRVVLRDIRGDRGTQFEAAQMKMMARCGSWVTTPARVSAPCSAPRSPATNGCTWSLPAGSGRLPGRWALNTTMTCSTPWPVTTSSTAAGSASCCAAPRSLRSSITGPAEPPPPSTAGHDLPMRLCRRGGDHRSRESGRHARVNILAVTVITDWRGPRPHTWPISQSTTTPPAREDQADELPFFRRPVMAGDRGCLRCCQPVDLHEGFHGLTRPF
jgi:hypothetical protein